MKNNKTAVFGCKSTSKYLLDHLHKTVGVSLLVTISPEKGEKMQVAGYSDLSSYAAEKGINCYVADKYSLKSQKDIEYINGQNIDVAFVMGWQRLVPREVLDGLRVGAFGMHGSSMNLPLGRGRSPMNWSIMEGRSVFYTNLFMYDPGVDSGGVVDTVKFQIGPKDTAATMHFKNALSMKYLITKNMQNLISGDFTVTDQREDLKPTYYPRRYPSNSLIDWSQDVQDIERFVRAVTKPFNGAYSFIGDSRIVIWRSQVFDYHEFGFEKEREGTVIEVFDKDNFLVKCFGGLLLVTAYDCDVEVGVGSTFHNGDDEIMHFDRNVHGYHDLVEES